MSFLLLFFIVIVIIIIIIIIITFIIFTTIIIIIIITQFLWRTHVHTPIRSFGSGGNNLTSDLFFSNGFKSFYETQVETVRKDIFEIYSGGQNRGGSAEEFSLREIVAMQKDKIQELEEKILVIRGGGEVSNERGNDDNDLNMNKDKNENENVNSDGRSEETKEEMQKLSLRIIELENNLTELEKQKKEIEIAAYEANEKIFEQMRNLAASESKILLLEEELEARVEDLGGMVRGEAVIAAEADLLRRRAESAEKTGKRIRKRSIHILFHFIIYIYISL